MRSIELFVPKGLPQRMHSKGSSCLMRIAWRAASVKLRRGSRAMTFYGQVFMQSPHCTQASSWKRSSGRSGLS
jgi:hypothetical protein